MNEHKESQDHLAAPSGPVPTALTVDAPLHTPGPLTRAMVRELRAINGTGEVGDLWDYGTNSLSFYAREKTLTALLRRQLIADEPGGYVLTNEGRAALAKAAEAA